MPLRRRVTSADRIVAWGFSLGTGVAVALAAEHPVGKLILEAPYTSTVDVAASAFRFVPVRLLMRDHFHSDQRIARVTAPLLVMHGDADPDIPIAFGERLFALAHEPKQFVRFPRGGHDNLDNFGAIETARSGHVSGGGVYVRARLQRIARRLRSGVECCGKQVDCVSDQRRGNYRRS